MAVKCRLVDNHNRRTFSFTYYLSSFKVAIPGLQKGLEYTWWSSWLAVPRVGVHRSLTAQTLTFVQGQQNWFSRYACIIFHTSQHNKIICSTVRNIQSQTGENKSETAVRNPLFRLQYPNASQIKQECKLLGLFDILPTSRIFSNLPSHSLNSLR